MGLFDSKNVFVLVLAHQEPELELFEVDDIGDDSDNDFSTIISPPPLAEKIR